MKNYKTAMTLIMALTCQILLGQVTFDDNIPVTGRYVGFNSTSLIDLPIENGGERMRLSFENWVGLNGLTNSNANRIAVPIDPSINITPIFSMMHLGDNTNSLLRRPWMNVGTSYIESGDIMYVGLLERPDPLGSNLATDAVVTWGCNDDFFAPQSGPDNLRFLFVAPTNSQSPGNAPQGLETMRITPNGNIGMGNSFNNNQQPARRLVVHEQTDSAQFRIAWGVDSNPLLGDHADFQVTNNGVLHIKPRHANNTRAVAIGFLDGELTNGVDNFARLDVGGRTRIRFLEDTASQCLITGFNASANPADNYLTRLDFTGATDSVLSGAGTWVPLSGTDCRWKETADIAIPSQDIMYMGFDPTADCYRTKLDIGTNALRSKVGIYNLISRNKVSAGLIVAAENDDTGWEASDNSGRIVGIISSADGPYEQGLNHYGIETFAERGKLAIGLVASAELGGSHSIGVDSTAVGALSTPGTPPNIPNIAYYGEVMHSGDAAAYLIGATISNQPGIGLSDASVKTDINEISNATELLSQLSPKTYYSVSPENRPMAFDDDLQYGLVAQEVQEVFP